jgi:Raf kinase inhibitor-like YbhB/YbcL family protein
MKILPEFRESFPFPFNYGNFENLIRVIKSCREQQEKGEIQMDLTTGLMGLSLTSPVFHNGGWIPEKFTKDGQNISPPLNWEPGPDETQSYVLIVDDPDAPLGTFDHWIIYNLPESVSSLEEGIPRGEILPDGSMQGVNSTGHVGYDGPAPPPGKPHRFFFKVYALDRKLDLHPGANKKEVLSRMRNHILGESELVGKYGR